MLAFLPKQMVKFTTLLLRLLLQRMENLLLTSFSEIILQVMKVNVMCLVYVDIMAELADRQMMRQTE